MGQAYQVFQENSLEISRDFILDLAMLRRQKGGISLTIENLCERACH